MLFSSTLLALRALLVLLCLRNVKAQSYTLADAYMPSNFFDMFDFYTGGDPTSGFVQYVNRSYAQSQGLVATYSDHVTIGVDHTNIYSSASPGRPSVRLTGIPVYTHGLYILSLSHMPYGCGTWPAFWSLGPDWPSHGEIDIIEGVNTNSRNLMSLHTSANCTTAGANQTGTLETSDCFIGDSNTGCGGYSASLSSYGSGFNNAGGGVYAMEWTSDHIRIWFFRRTAIPASITAGNPDPAADFGKPSANFQGSCDIDSHFGDHNIILDNTFCGDFAGNSYGSTSCPMTSGLTGKQSCQEYVAKNPSAFTEAYWSINYLKVFQLSNPSEITSSSVSLSSVTPVASTASVSSLDVALGVDSSNTVLVSQTLSLPSTGEVTATVSSQSTYFGPNTVTVSSSSSLVSSTTFLVSPSTSTTISPSSGSSVLATSVPALPSSSSKVSSSYSSPSSSIVTPSSSLLTSSSPVPQSNPASMLPSPSSSMSTASSVSKGSSNLSASTLSSSSGTLTATQAPTMTSSHSSSLTSAASFGNSTATTPTASSTQSPGALPTTSATDGGEPLCRSIYIDEAGTAFRIYCNATIEGLVLKVNRVNDLSACIKLCEAYDETCTASVWSNATMPGNCALMGNTANSMVKRATATLGIDPGAITALRLENAAAPAPDDPTTTLTVTPSLSTTVPASSVLTAAATTSTSAYSTITTVSVVSSVSVSTVIIGTVTTTTSCDGCVVSTSNVGSASLCVTCGLVPIIVTTGPVGNPAMPTPSSSAIVSLLTTSGPGTCPATKVTKYITTWVTTQIPTCGSPLTCFAPTSSVAPPSPIFSGTTTPPSCPAAGFNGNTVFIDPMGTAYAVYCDSMLSDVSASLQNRANFVDCMLACDMWNVVHFYAADEMCAGVTFYTDGVSPNCLLKSTARSINSMTNAIVGIRLTGSSGGRDPMLNGSVPLPVGMSSSLAMGSMSASGSRTLSLTAGSGNATSGPGAVSSLPSSTGGPSGTNGNNGGVGSVSSTSTSSSSSSSRFVFPTLTLSSNDTDVTSRPNRFINTVTTTVTSTEITTTVSVTTTSIYITETVTVTYSRTPYKTCRTDAVHATAAAKRMMKRDSVLKGLVFGPGQEWKAMPGSRPDVF